MAAKTGTEGCKFAESIADEYGFTVVQFDTSAMMYQDVLAGNSVACFEDYPVMGYEISQGMDLKLLDKLESRQQLRNRSDEGRERRASGDDQCRSGGSEGQWHL